MPHSIHVSAGNWLLFCIRGWTAASYFVFVPFKVVLIPVIWPWTSSETNLMQRGITQPPGQLLPTSPLPLWGNSSSPSLGNMSLKTLCASLFLATTHINVPLESSANLLSFCLTKAGYSQCWPSRSRATHRQGLFSQWENRVSFRNPKRRSFKPKKMPSKSASRKHSDINIRILMTSNLFF